MNYDTLQVEYRSGAAWLWMNQPAVHNAFDESSWSPS
jgi:enoyl-CoA hydratase/carnithine racemase